MVFILPIRYAINKLLIGNGDTIIFLSLFHLHLNLMILPKIGDLLDVERCTFESTQPFLTPSLFMATKFFSGSLVQETVCCCQPETTALVGTYLHVLHIDP